MKLVMWMGGREVRGVGWGEDWVARRSDVHASAFFDASAHDESFIKVVVPLVW